MRLTFKRSMNGHAFNPTVGIPEMEFGVHEPPCRCRLTALGGALRQCFPVGSESTGCDRNHFGSNDVRLASVATLPL
jgi:hypothetical protein